MYIPANKELTKAEIVALNTTLSAIEESCKQDGYNAECYFIEAEDGDPDLEEGIQIDIRPGDYYLPNFYLDYRFKTGFSFKIQTTSYGPLNFEQFDGFISGNEVGYRLAKGIYGSILRCIQLIRKEEVQVTSSKKVIKSGFVIEGYLGDLDKYAYWNDDYKEWEDNWEDATIYETESEARKNSNQDSDVYYDDSWIDLSVKEIQSSKKAIKSSRGRVIKEMEDDMGCLIQLIELPDGRYKVTDNWQTENIVDDLNDANALFADYLG